MPLGGLLAPAKLELERTESRFLASSEHSSSLSYPAEALRAAPV
jgi:hypothetical protein